MVIFVSECVFSNKDTMINLTFCQYSPKNAITLVAKVSVKIKMAMPPLINWKIPISNYFPNSHGILKDTKAIWVGKNCRAIKHHKNVLKWTCESLMMGLLSLTVDIKMSFYAKLNMKRQWHHIRKWFGSLKKWSLTLNKDGLSMKIKNHLRISRSFRILLIDVFQIILLIRKLIEFLSKVKMTTLSLT